MPTGTVRLHRVLKAPPERGYRAFVEPAALTKWIPPHGFVGEVQHVEPRVGGTFRMSFTNGSPRFRGERTPTPGAPGRRETSPPGQWNLTPWPPLHEWRGGASERGFLPTPWGRMEVGGPEYRTESLARRLLC